MGLCLPAVTSSAFIMYRIFIAHLFTLLIAAGYFEVTQVVDIHLPIVINGRAEENIPTATGTVTITATPIPTDEGEAHGPPVTVTPTATPIPPTAAPTATPQPCTDPTSCAVVSSISAHWRCNIPSCTGADWTAAAITWPSWSAYKSNGRAGDNSRTVYSLEGELLYPYMGSWANGCQVTTIEGTALIVEWQRGTDVWRETLVPAGESHTINLTSPEDGAEIVSHDTLSGFSIALSNCTPQVISKPPARISGVES